MAQSKAHIAATGRYEAKAYDKILLRLRKDTEPTRATIAKAAESQGMSLNGFIMDAITQKMSREDSGSAYLAKIDRAIKQKEEGTMQEHELIEV